MEFKCVETPEEVNVNVTPTHPLREAFVLGGGIFLIILLVYIVAGIILDFMIPRISPEVEKALGNAMLSSMPEGNSGDDQAAGYVQGVLDGLVNNLETKNFSYKVIITKREDPNALAVPGGTIILFSDLLSLVTSENGLAMVLAHELGHYAARDHLKGIGRQLIVAVFCIVALGGESGLSQFFSGALTGLENRYSQDQEYAADAFGLHLLNKTYGHAGGALEFFRCLSESGKDFKRFEILSTHPLTAKRIKRLESMITTLGLPEREVIPLPQFMDKFKPLAEEPTN